jgi:hypothetical protein
MTAGTRRLPPGRYRFRHVARMEWIKLASLRSTWATLGITIAAVSVAARLGLLPGSGPVIRADSSKHLAVFGRAFQLTCRLGCRHRPGSPAGLIRSLSARVRVTHHRCAVWWSLPGRCRC